MKPLSNDEDDLTDAEIAGLKLAFGAIAETTRAQAGPHLQVEDLERYYYRQMNPESRQQARTHLVSCDQCSSRLLEYAAFCDPSGDELVALEEVGAAGNTNTDLAPSFLVRVQAFFLRPQIAYALVLILLIVGLLWISSSRRERRELLARLNQPVTQDETARDSQESSAEIFRKIEDVQQQRDAERSRVNQLEARNAQLEAEKNALNNKHNSRTSNAALLVNVPVLQLPNQKRSGDVSVIDVPANATVFTLVVPDPAPDKTFSEYEIEIRNLTGITMLRKNGLHFSKVLNDKALTLMIPTRLVPAGQYWFSVYGITDDGRKVEGEQLILVRYK